MNILRRFYKDYLKLSKGILRLIIAGVFFIISACGGEFLFIQEVAAYNREKINLLSVGMSKSEVLTWMGTKTIAPSNSSLIITNPYRTSTFQGKDKINFEVLFYYTDFIDYEVKNKSLTPIIIKDDKVVGWGWTFLNDNVVKYEIDIE